jgi:hypothetical protein
MNVSLDAPLPRSQVYMDEKAFRSTYRELMAATKCSFSKLETRQVYQEPGDASLSAFLKGDRMTAHALLRQPLEGADAESITASRRDISWTRIRLVEFPLTPYLQWELLTYQVSVKYGERILLTDVTGESRTSVLRRGDDFLMFDKKTVLAHNYDREGHLQGAWLIEKDSHVAQYAAFFEHARQGAVPLGVFEAQHKLPHL